MTTQTGENWFLHFQDKGTYGRIVHLQPMFWKNDFPVMGVDKDGDGTGEPILSHKKPNVGGNFPFQTPPDSDEFNSENLGFQWQWHANPQPTLAFTFPATGVLRMNSVQLPENHKNLWDLPNLLLQKFPTEKFTVTTKVTLNPRFEGEKFGLVVMGLDYSYIGITNKDGKLFVSQVTVKDADKGNQENETAPVELKSKEFYLRVKISEDAICNFSFSTDGKNFKARRKRFQGARKQVDRRQSWFVFYSTGKINDAGTLILIGLGLKIKVFSFLQSRKEN